ncbi:hypothetical protein HUS23_14120 [Ectothiorhodospiraceae bacterium 2226]|nr:hypothetical protein HUS23_14120 [Ectothiorhodospiraceae bacterium 2226]
MPRFAAMLFIAMGFAVAGSAQSVDVPGPEWAAEVAIQMPVKGMSKDRVERDYGAPAERRAAVGEPPISRWVYDAYTVYFENQYVIHAVPHAR